MGFCLPVFRRRTQQKQFAAIKVDPSPTEFAEIAPRIEKRPISQPCTREIVERSEKYLVFRWYRVVKTEMKTRRDLRKPMPTNLMGVDVGFSKTRRTTGIGCLEGDHLTLERAGTAWESRKAKIPDGFKQPLSPLMDHWCH
jgi:hypothetical protein